VAQQSRDLAIDATLIATRADIEAFLRGGPDNRLEQGWRAELVGATVGRIVAGKAAVAYDGAGRLVLVDV
jgi:ribonuclease D